MKNSRITRVIETEEGADEDADGQFSPHPASVRYILSDGRSFTFLMKTARTLHLPREVGATLPSYAFGSALTTGGTRA